MAFATNYLLSMKLQLMAVLLNKQILNSKTDIIIIITTYWVLQAFDWFVLSQHIPVVHVLWSLSKVYGTYSLALDPNGIVGEGLYLSLIHI